MMKFKENADINIGTFFDCFINIKNRVKKQNKRYTCIFAFRQNIFYHIGLAILKNKVEKVSGVKQCS